MQHCHCNQDALGLANAELSRSSTQEGFFHIEIQAAQDFEKTGNAFYQINSAKAMVIVEAY